MERHLLVFVMTTLAVVGRWVLDPWLADSAQYTLLYFVVAFAAAVAGWRAGLVAMLVGGAASFYLITYLPGRFASEGRADLIQFGLYAAVGTLIAVLAEWGRRQTIRAGESGRAGRRIEEEFRGDREHAEEALRLQILKGVNRILESTLDAKSKEELGETCLAIAKEITASKLGFIGEIDADGYLHDLAMSTPGWSPCQMFDQGGHQAPPGSFAIPGIYGRVLVDRKSVIANDPAAHPDRIGLPEGHPPLTAFLGVPVLRDHELLGMIAVGNRDGGYGSDQQQALEALAPALAAALVHKRAEEQLRRQAALIDLSPDAIIVRDLRGTVKLWSKGAERLYGWKKEEVIDQNVDLLLETEFPEPLEKVVEQLQGGRDWTGELVHKAKDGQKLVVQSFWHLERIHGGLEILESNVNITILKRVEEELRAARLSAERAKEAAERANAAKDQFLAVLSHELRTPLAPVLIAVQLMERTEDLSEKGRQYVEVIRRNLGLEARLIDDLLDLTRIEHGKISLEKEVIDICTVIQRVADICMPDIEAKKLHFGIDLKDPPHRVCGDAARLQQALWNLVKNSIKFTPEGGCVGIRGFRDGSELVVEVTDSGIGIEPGSLSRIFDAFEQGDRRITRQFGGLGLGLAITKRLVEMHGGTISAKSGGKNEGAIFRVTLPLAVKAPGPAEEKKQEARQAPSIAARRILLVEDHTDTAAMMKDLLQVSGYEVETAADVAQSLEAIGRTDFDLLISDLGLPDGSGLQLMEELRRRHNPLKGIALSGFGREEDVRKSKEAGFAEHLTKPVDFDALLAAVGRVI
jgi:PAS domain S-box-containing protein